MHTTHQLTISLLASVAMGCATGGSVDEPDGGGRIDAGVDAFAEMCVNEPCDLLEQCGCQDPEVCDLNLDELPTGGTACREVTSPGTETGRCSSATECAAGFVCLGSPGQCRRYCDEAQANACGDGGLCRINVVYDSGGGNFQNVPGAVTCSKSCAPEQSVNNGCPDGFGCTAFVAEAGTDDEFWFSDCRSAPASGGGDGADCSENGVRDCAPGFTCVVFSVDNEVTSRECKQTCTVNDMPECTNGTCQAFTGDNPPTIDGTEYGFCDV